MESKSLKRRLELSSKFMEMGQALLIEGNDSKDYCITQSGTFLILIAGLIISEEDVYEFGQLCSMFSAKKLLDDLEYGNSSLIEYLKGKTGNDSYDDIIKRLNKLRGDNEEPPLA